MPAAHERIAGREGKKKTNGGVKSDESKWIEGVQGLGVEAKKEFL